MSQRLLILACSQRKRNDAGLLPAIERYDGPAFQVTRKYRRDCPSAAELLNIQILSAKFGLIDSDKSIPNYDQKMVNEEAQNLQAELHNRLETIVKSARFDEAFIYVSQVYLKALGDYQTVLPTKTHLVSINSTPGRKLVELRKWLYQGNQPHTNPTVRNKGEIVSVKGIKLFYTPDQILSIARQQISNQLSQATNYSSWYVNVDGQKIAPKWLVSQLTGLSLSSFHTDTAKRVLEQLGIEVHST